MPQVRQLEIGSAGGKAGPVGGQRALLHGFPPPLSWNGEQRDWQSGGEGEFDSEWGQEDGGLLWIHILKNGM